MAWSISRISSSLLGLLRESDSRPSHDQQLETIREEMLEIMAGFLEGKSVRPAVWGKVLYAKDVLTLWYLRSDLLHLVSHHLGEHAAQNIVDKITPLFQGLIPNAMFASARRKA